MLMRSTLLLLLIATVLAAGPDARAASIDPGPGEIARFVSGTEDVPLMPGLNEIADATLVFDKPEGRIVEAAARGRVRRGDVIAFYSESLYQLGWRRHGDHAYIRDDERLSLGFGGKNGLLTVDFMLEPL